MNFNSTSQRRPNIRIQKSVHVCHEVVLFHILLKFFLNVLHDILNFTFSVSIDTPYLLFYDFPFTGIGCWNPAFDVTPAELITGGIITEYGVYKPGELKQKLQNCKS